MNPANMSMSVNSTKVIEAAVNKINTDKKAKQVIPVNKKPDVDKVKSDIDKFKRFVDGTGLAVHYGGGRTYLLAEAWLYIAELKHLNVSTTCAEETINDTFTVTCAVNLIDKNGNVVSSGVMQASDKEGFLSDKEKFAVYGMAQTRAISRAVRNKYGYIARACGFQSTPIDEIPPEDRH